MATGSTVVVAVASLAVEVESDSTVGDGEDSVGVGLVSADVVVDPGSVIALVLASSSSEVELMPPISVLSEADESIVAVGCMLTSA